MIYLVTVAQVAVKLKPSFGRIAAMVVSGFIPFLAFFVEHNTVEDLKALDATTSA